MVNVKQEILKAIGDCLENNKFRTPGDYVIRGKLLNNPTVRSVFNSVEKEGILNKIVGNYFLAYGGHFGPKNPEMDKYCQENGYGKSDCNYNTLLNNVLKKSSVMTEEKEEVFNY